MSKPKLLIIEDDEGLRSQYRWAFPACELFMAHAKAQAVILVKRENPPVAIMDLGLPPDPDGVSEGFATLTEVLRIAPRIKVIVVTGNDERKNALRAVGLGAYDFCEKPIEIEISAYRCRARAEPPPARRGEPSAGGRADAFSNRTDRHRKSADAEGLP